MHQGGHPRGSKGLYAGLSTSRYRLRPFNSHSGLTQSEDDGHGEIQPGADQRRQSECETGGNRKANVGEPVFVAVWRALGVDLAVLGSVAASNYNGFPVRATLHGDFSDAKIDLPE
jgi:hypothetical protein